MMKFEGDAGGCRIGLRSRNRKPPRSSGNPRAGLTVGGYRSDGHEDSTSDMRFADCLARHLEPPAAAPSNVGRQSRFLEPDPGETGLAHPSARERMPQPVNVPERRWQRRIAMPRRDLAPKAAPELPGDLQARLTDSRGAGMTFHAEIPQNGGYSKRVAPRRRTAAGSP